MKLTKKQLQQVQNALLSGYDEVTLRLMVRLELGEDLAAIAGGDSLPLRVRVFNLIDWAERCDRVFELIDGAKSQLNSNADIELVWQESQFWRERVGVEQNAEPLTGKQVQELQNALLNAYSSVDELRMMVRIQLDENLEAVAGGRNLRVLVFNLITWAEQNGRVSDLIGGARRDTAGNAALQALAQSWRTATPVSAPAQPKPRTEDAAPALPVTIELFLSYSRKDHDAMRVVWNTLREAGISIWTDEGLKPGTRNWRVSIEEAVAQASAMVVLLSPDAKKSQWVDNEVGYAQELNIPIVPVLVAGDTASSVPISLIRVQWVDGRQDLRSTVIQQLRPAVLDYLGRPQAAATAANIEVIGPRIEQPERQQTTISPIAFAWVTIPAGKFLMGSETDFDEKPQHAVYLSEYRIAKYPVTNGQYMDFVKATSHEPPKHWEKRAIPYGKENHPVVGVSWYDALAYCEWADVRLPTEAEWEKAARGTKGQTYPWGDDPPSKDLCNFRRPLGDTTPVDAYPQGASPYGVMDMAGNAWEWTSSFHKSYPYRSNDGRENPEDEVRRVLRGGAWFVDDSGVRCASREAELPGKWNYSIGFRFVSLGS